MNRRTARPFIIATLGALLALAAGGANAAAAKQCRDTNGRFVKCPEAAATANHCRDITTKKYVKCGTPHSEAVPASGGK
ncbi:MAG: hypothetical protein QM696_07470 [Steroidobacteraceae bacterium]